MIDIEKKNPELQLTPEMIEAMMREQPVAQEKKLEDVFGIEEATAKMMLELVKTDRINILTDLTFEEIQSLTVAEAFGSWLLEKTGCVALLELTGLYKELKISIGRRGRTEIIELGTFAGAGLEEKKLKLGGFLGMK